MSEEIQALTDEAITSGQEEAQEVEEQEDVTPEEPTDEAEEQADEEEEEESQVELAKKKTAKGVQKRLDELTAQREEAKKERDYWREMAQKAMDKTGIKPVEEPEIAEIPEEPIRAQKPRIEDFDTDEEFFEALTEWKIEEREAKSRYESEIAKARRIVDEKDSVGRKKYQDYDTVVRNPNLPVSNVAAEAALASEHTAEIMYALGKDLEEAKRIFNLPPLAQLRELAKIEERVASKGGQASPAPKKTTSAPEPITPVRADTPAMKSDPERMSTADYIKWRNEQEYYAKKK